jgi:flavin reductase (DIM6/NTAB) family NADH-FMN oxidoreductase RutF
MKTQINPYVHCFPAPVVLIGCGTVDKPNLITCSWFGTACSKPPTVYVSIRESRYSFPLIREIGEFTANIPRISDLDAAIHCGTKSGRDTNKFEDLNFTPVACPPLKNAPMIAECSLVLACKVNHEIPLGSHNMFIAEVVNIHCDEPIVRDDGKADPFPEDQITWLNKKYWSLKLLK